MKFHLLTSTWDVMRFVLQKVNLDRLDLQVRHGRMDLQAVHQTAHVRGHASPRAT